MGCVASLLNFSPCVSAPKQGVMHQSEIMNRPPIPSDPFNRQYIYKGVVFHWSLSTGFVYLICLAISKASPISIVLLIPCSVVLFLCINGITNDFEFKTLYKKLDWYRKYTIATFLLGVLFGISCAFEASADFAVIIAFPVFANGLFLWPLVTTNTYVKNYTRLFGVFDA